MDLSTLDKRRRACEAEIAVNRADAPKIHLAALPITRKGEMLEIRRKGETVEWLTHMRRFDVHATLNSVATQDGLSDAVNDELGLAIRRSHARAPPRDGVQCGDALETYIEHSDAAFGAKIFLSGFSPFAREDALTVLNDLAEGLRFVFRQKAFGDAGAMAGGRARSTERLCGRRAALRKID
jgi:hypothetical protein